MRIKTNRGTPPKSMRKTSACLRTGITAPTMPPQRRRRNCPVPPKTASRQLRRRRERRRTAESPESLGIDLGIEQGGKGEKCREGLREMKRALPSTRTGSGEAAPLRRAPPTAANTVDSSASAVAFSSRLLLQWLQVRVGCASKCDAGE